MKILVLFPKALYSTKVSPARRHAIAAVGRQEDVELVVSGHGWPGWDESQTALANCERALPDADVVWWYKPLGAPKDGVPPLNDPKQVSVRKLTVLSFNECWWPDWRAAREVEDTGTRLTIIHHANDCWRFTDRWLGSRTNPQIIMRKADGVVLLEDSFIGMAMAGRFVHHIPHSAEASVFGVAARLWKDRDIDVLLTGVQNEATYPLRHRFKRLIEHGKLPGKCVVHPHPGYRASSLEQCDARVMEYAEMLGRSKIALVCSSVHRYPLAKYVEAAMAGCCVLGDMPRMPPPHYPNMMVNLSAMLDHTAELFWDKMIESWVTVLLRDQKRLEAMATSARERASSSYSQDAYAERFVSAAEAALASC